jgi:hypothetical protein
MVFTSTGLRGGVWQGVLHAATAPSRVSLEDDGVVLATARVTPAAEAGAFHVRVQVPSDWLSDGAHCFQLIADDGQGDEAPGPDADRLAALPVTAGAAHAEDMRSEIALIRAELDLLKREVRRLGATGPDAPL